MSGWVVAFARGRALDERRWRRALAAAGEGENAHSRLGRGFGIGAWRRSTGEFPCSGRLTTSPGGVVGAWMGQCLEDNGDATERAIEALSRGIEAAGDAAGLNGPFAAAFVSTTGLTVWTDRHNHYPVYVHEGDDVAVASTLLACVLPWLGRPEIDRDSVDLLLRTGELLDERTVVRGVRMLRGGSVLTVSGERAETKRYWRMRHEAAARMTIGKAARELGGLLQMGVRRVERATERLGAPLSGGLDSRLLLGLCEKPEKVPSFTLGLPGCRDVRYAEMFARAVGSPHRVLAWDLPEFPRMWAGGVEATGGGYGVTEMYMLPYARVFAAECDATLNGLGGDTALGGNFLKLAWLRSRSLPALAGDVWRWKVGEGLDRWADRLMGRSGNGGAKEVWRASLCAEEGETACARLVDWLIENRTFRYVNCGTMLLRTAVESHAPFFDRDYVDVLRTVPLELRLKHRLYLRVLNQACPAAASVPWQRTALPPAWGFPVALASLMGHRLAKEAGKRAGVEVLASMRMNDPDGWFRAGPWHDAAREILGSEECLGRGVFEPDAVLGLLRAHEEGAALSRPIGVMLGVELFCRRSLDGVLAEGAERDAAPLTAA